MGKIGNIGKIWIIGKIDDIGKIRKIWNIGKAVELKGNLIRRKLEIYGNWGTRKYKENR